MTRKVSDLLARPAPQSVRLIALAYLDEAAGALVRLKDAEDGEALHDFRVALRRLRTTLRAYRPLLEGSVPRRVRRRLREVADGTNAARDAEVALAWLRPLEAEFLPRERVGLHWLFERIEHARTKDRPRALAVARRSFAGVERKLRRGLLVYRRTVVMRGTVPEQRFGSVAGTTLLDQANRLDAGLATVDAQDEEPVHRARIAAKRLRYEIEPVAEGLIGGGNLVRRLKQLQDLLGELHDLFELEDEVRRAMEAAAVARADRLWELTLDTEPESAAVRAAQRRRQNPGLLAVARRSRARRRILFGQLRTEWLGKSEAWSQGIQLAIAPLMARSGPARAPATARRPARRRVGRPA